MSALLTRGLAALVAVLAGPLVVMALLASAASAAPLLGSNFDSNDGDQVPAGVSPAIVRDWQDVASAPRLTTNLDSQAADDCFIGGVKEDTPKDWNFNVSAGGCTPGKSDLLGMWSQSELTPTASILHASFVRQDPNGNTFITFELNRVATRWTNSAGASIPCRSTGDLLMAYDIGGSTIDVTIYRWTGDGAGPPACPNGAAGTFTASAAANNGKINPATITNYLSTGVIGTSIAKDLFGEAQIDVASVLASMGVSGCFSYVQAQAHTRSSSSISSALIDNVPPVATLIANCAVTGTVFGDSNADGVRNGVEEGIGGRTVYVDVDGDGGHDGGEPSATTDATGYYLIPTTLTSGTHAVRVVPAGSICTTPVGCAFNATFTAAGTNSVNNVFGLYVPATVSGAAFADTNANGTRGAGENTPIAGRTVFHDADNDGVLDTGEPSATTALDGSYTVGGLLPGTARIRLINGGGWVCDAPAGCVHALTVAGGDVVTGRDYLAYRPPTVSGAVFTDADADATRDGGDADRGGVTVNLYAADGTTLLGAAVTDPAGSYSFSTANVPGFRPGGHVVRVVAPPAMFCSAPCATAITLSSGQALSMADAGVYANASISGTAYTDSDDNAARNGGEPPAPGVIVYADLDGDGSRDAGEPFATTDPAGGYTLAGIRPGAVHVHAELAPSFACSTPAGCDHLVTPTSGDVIGGRDFGLVQAATATGRVAVDDDGSGTAAPGEPPLAGWTVYFDVDGDGQRDAGEPSAVTLADGTYSLGNITPGTRTIRVDAPAGWVCSSPCSRSVPFASGTTTPGLDFALYEPAGISGTVYEDLDGDGTRDAGEPGLLGREVFFDANDNDVADIGEPSSTSDVNGAYSLIGVTPDAGTIRGSLPAGYVRAEPTTDGYAVTLSSSDVLSRDFGGYRTGSIAGHTTNDLNGNGVDDLGEPGKAGWTMYLDIDNSGTLGVGEPTATTDAGGDYLFDGLPPATYRVRPLITAGFTCTKPAQCVYVNALFSGENATARDFALVEAASVSGTVYADADADATRDGGEGPRAGRTVYVDYDGDGALDLGEPYATTNAAGAYTVLGVSPGTFSVSYDAPVGEHISEPAAEFHSVTFGSGDAPAGRDFGSWVNAAISGEVYDDADNSGSRQPGEGGLGGRTVNLDAGADGSVDDTMTTDTDGAYAFTGLTPGDYRVTVSLPAAYACNAPAPCRWDRTVSSANASTGNNFGLYRVPVADLWLTKSAPADVDQGETFDYTLTVTNNGPDAAQGVEIGDTLPGGVQFVSASAGCDHVAPRVTCTLGSVAGGASPVRTITVRAIDAGAIANMATVTSPTGDPSPANDSDDADVTVAAVADVSVTKTGPDVVDAGASATYTLTAHNDGPSDGTGVVLRDTLPSGMTFDAGASDPGWSEESPGVYKLVIGDLADGASASRDIVLTAEHASADTTQTDSASIDADQDDNTPGNDSDSVATDVGPSADLRMSKTVDDATIFQGQNAIYTLTVTNDGPSAASGIQLADDLPAGVTFVSLPAPAGFSCTTPAVGATGLVTCSAATLANGAAATFILTVSGDADGEQSNTAEVSSQTPDGDEADNDDTVKLDVAAAADISLAKDGPAGVGAGDQATYTLTATNEGPSTAHNVVVSDPLPAGMTFVSLTASAGTSCTTPAVGSGGTVTCTTASLADGDDVELTLVVRASFAAADQTLTNTASASADEFDPDSEDDEASAETGVGPAADLRLQKTASVAALTQNSQLTYTLQAFNDGPSTATNVTISDTLPGGMSFVSASAGCTNNAGTVTCDLADIADGASRTVTITVRADANGPQVNEATVSSDQPDPDPTDNPATAAVEVGPTADLSIDKTGPATVSAGGQLTYTLTAHNDGASAATGVTIVDELPEGMTYLASNASQGSCVFTAGTVTCALGALADDADATATITLRATFALAGTTVHNSATISGDQNDDDAGDDSSTHDVEVGPAADLVVSNDAPARVPAGRQLLYNLQVTNNGPQTAGNAVLTTTLPAGLTFVSANPSRGSCSAAGQTVTCAVGNLASGGAAQVLLTVTVAGNLSGRDVASNAVAASDTTEMNTSNNDDDATTAVDAAAVVPPPPPPPAATPAAAAPPPAPAGNLTVTKTADKGAKAVLGSSLAFTLRVTNATDHVAHNVVAVDQPSAAVDVGSVRPQKGRCSGLTCRLGDLQPGEVVLIHVTMTPRKAGTFENSVVVTSDDGDRDEADNQAAAAVRVASKRTTLSLRKTADRKVVKAGGTMWFTITARNTGTQTASNVRVCDTPGFNTTYVTTRAAKMSRGRACWTLKTLKAGGRVSYRVKVRVSGTTRTSAATNATVTASNAGVRTARKSVRVVAGTATAGGVTG